ncbi:MAG: hypothetical protein ACPGRX_04565, partial [Bdellovibrionales bacterium]
MHSAKIISFFRPKFPEQQDQTSRSENATSGRTNFLILQSAKIVGFFKNKRKRIEHTCGLFLKKRRFA